MSALANNSKLNTGIGRRGSRLMPYDVRLIADNHIVARLCQHFQGDLIGHCAAGKEEGGLLSQELGDSVLKHVDARVFAILVVTDRRLGHGGTHCLGRLSHGI